MTTQARPQQQFLANLNSAQQIHAHVNHKLKLTLKPLPAEEVMVSRERATDFKKWMGK